MKKEVIKKNKAISAASNLPDYELARRTFSWPQAWREIDSVNGRLNAAENAVGRQAKNWRKNKIALYWIGANGETAKFTFQELDHLANQFAHGLETEGIVRGKRVFFFLTRVPALYYGFLGTLKTGAIAGTMFAAFGHQAILDRLGNSGATALVTEWSLLERVTKAAAFLPELKTIFVVDEPARVKKIKIKGKKIIALSEHIANLPREYRTKMLPPSAPAFMLYTSGTTGKPKGVVHAHEAIVHEHWSAKYALDLRDDDVYWCTADPGWVTGIAYSILGSWSNGAAAVMYNGKFSPENWYSIIADYGVTVWYTAPTAIRMLKAAGSETAQKFDLRSLRHLASVGEPLNPEAIRWGLKTFGLPFHDNWWQTETGGILIANLPCLDIRPGSMGKPLPGITAAIMSDDGKILGPNKEGNLVIKPNWPSLMKKIWRRPSKYRSYFEHGWYVSGDRAFVDTNGYYWFIGRADDVIKTSGERVGPFEVESALVEHPDIIEAGVIGKPDPLRGEIIKAFVKLKPGVKESEELKLEIQQFIKKNLAGHAYPREISFVSSLPKTRSGKIMRRLLKARELGLPLGDTSTLEEY